MDSDEVDSDPKYLYRYRGCNKNSFSELANGNVWFSTLDMYNDPFEVLIDHFHFIGNFEKHKHKHMKEKEEELNAFFEASIQTIAAQVKSVGVLCFSSKNNNHLMWSHYADSHNGFCIEYKRNTKENMWQATRPVNYVDDITELFNGIVSYISKCKVEGCVPIKNPKEKSEEIIYTKNSQWSYENEWRLIDGNTGSRLTRLPVDISRIIFGFRMSTGDKQTVYNLTRNIDGIKYSQCNGAINNKFKMEIEELPTKMFR